MNTDAIMLTVPAKPDYVMVTRLTSSAVASRIGFDVDQIEDIKMSVAEAQILILNQTTKPTGLTVKFEIKSQELYIEISGESGWQNDEDSYHDIDQAQMSRFIISSMMDEVEFKLDRDILKTICMHKRCGGIIDQ